MEPFSALLALCAGNSPVSGEFPSPRPVTRSFDVFFDLRLNKQLSKQPWGWWFETPPWSLWRQCNGDEFLAYQLNQGWLIDRVYIWKCMSGSLYVFKMSDIFVEALCGKKDCSYKLQVLYMRNLNLDISVPAWWRHQMETFSALLALCAENSPVSGDFPLKRPVTWSFDVFFDLRLNKRLSKQSWGWWFEMPPCSLWRHCNVS